ncbi:Hypothetical protein SMAX5B_003905 [Scophthalmus maximus]|uniref:Uncharacterized protein n=1 Tax=Scophthalmus maximus TaxID=52904 RepID=A0A2U9AVJ0_SCOMX|nr:Hypothetical protein SMAX5B_003905 [Scophthalmus maximus]
MKAALYRSTDRGAGVQQLSRHFSWPEFCDERQSFHQDFVYDVAMFAAAHGFPWPDVVQAAEIAKGLFPQLDGLDVPRLLSLLRDALSERLPHLTPVHRHTFTQFLADTCLGRRRLLQAVVGGAANMSVARLHRQVQLPPTPPPLAQLEASPDPRVDPDPGSVVVLQGIEPHEWERARLTSTLQQKEEELRSLRHGSRVTLGDIPDDVPLDEEFPDLKLSVMFCAGCSGAGPCSREGD